MSLLQTETATALLDAGACPRLVPVILSGGSGSRLWPLSRERYPKQLLRLVGENTLIQDTALRVADPALFEAPLVLCHSEHRFTIAEQVQAVGIRPRSIILEPCARNTAAAVAVAALAAGQTDPGAVLAVLPADHVVLDRAAFHDAMRRAARAASLGYLTMLGITPARAECGYGYLEQGEPIPDAGGACQVRRFTEKPSRAVAEDYVGSGRHFWNSGMVVAPAAVLLEELRRHAPAVLAAAQAALEAACRDLDFTRLDPVTFATAPQVSLDYAVLEKTDRTAMVPAAMGWTDVGAWSALWDIGAQDADGNVALGDVQLVDTRDSYIRSDDVLTAVVGLDNIVVVVTEDAVLVADKGRVQEVKQVTERLRALGRGEAMEHRRVYRPWGFYQSVHLGERFQVKRLTVKPGCKLSLQKHYHRAEHWIVVNGTALVTRDGEQILVRENESVYLPLGTVHRLENPGRLPLNLIEVQTGSYLGEDDIVRLEDSYNRV
ncbi:mannose-1-phosphate guanylyltransferase/mannose-6-phosphate isomerase [Oleisolibacter albus]|uniref:mannose-1-phosphate guanylyltransferase/mannose-6-phosphate isomerase n=1 Tax=Oleisolibacter albus TaxID=2171757 RepID=UPI000DF23CA3|nr:mannose-1-phosphate guanylyltransferase/mannose-6-phosphate isomerase [Oleisolibacter albus]